MGGTWRVQVSRFGCCNIKPPLIPNPLAAEDHRIILWDIGSGRAIKHLTGHTSSIHALSFSADSAILTSGGADCTVRCWDVKGSGAGQQANGLYDPYAMGGAAKDWWVGKPLSQQSVLTRCAARTFWRHTAPSGHP